MTDYELLAVTRRGEDYWMELSDGDSYRIVRIDLDEASLLQATLDSGAHVYMRPVS